MFFFYKNNVLLPGEEDLFEPYVTDLKKA